MKDLEMLNVEAERVIALIAEAYVKWLAKAAELLDAEAKRVALLLDEAGTAGESYKE